MKGRLVSFLTFQCLVSLVQCYGGKGYDVFEKFLEAQSLKRSVNYADKDWGNEYSPVFIGLQEGLKEANKITALPGQPKGVNFDQYSGYVTVDPSAGRALFYYYVESGNSSTKPLVLWLNGGPGCSSLGAGAMTELGPFRASKDGKTLWHNEYAWNNVANILFLESPAGVGFSYSNTSSDYTTGDKQTAADSYTFLINWLERFPEYKTRYFFIAGESYAGHYVPQLAQLILHNNKITNQTAINLKGIAIGNAYVDGETLDKGRYEYYWSHSLISDEIYQGIVSNCKLSSEDVSDTCQEYTIQAGKAMGNIYGYDIYAPLCSSSSNTSPSISGFDPCSDNYVFSYLNIPEVQKMLHANTTGISGPWGLCNGDTDGTLTVTTTRYDIKKLGVPVKTPWYPWYIQGEVGGYVEEYENLTFVTIRGAGHFVPSYQPARALAMFSAFIAGELPPSNEN